MFKNFKTSEHALVSLGVGCLPAAAASGCGGGFLKDEGLKFFFLMEGIENPLPRWSSLLWTTWYCLLVRVSHVLYSC